MRISRENYSFFMWTEAVLANIFLVPTPSKAISSRVSLPIFVAVSTMPLPKALCWIMSPLCSSSAQELSAEDEEVIDLCCELENVIVLLNKSDLEPVIEPSDLPFMYIIRFSAQTGEGMEQFVGLVEEFFDSEMPCDGSILTNARQFDAIRRAKEALDSALKGLRMGFTPDAVLTDVEGAMEAMGEVTGATVREDITARKS